MQVKQWLAGLGIFFCLGMGWALAQAAEDNYADSLRTLAIHAKDGAEASDRWLELSKYYRRSNLDSTQVILNRAKLAAKISKDVVRMQRCSMSQAMLNWMQGNFDEAEKGYLAALQFWEGRKDTVEVARCLLNLGAVAQGSKNMQQSITYLRKALAAARLKGETLIAAQSAGSICNAFFQVGAPDSITKYTAIAIEGFSKLKDSANLARANANLGYYYREMGMSYEARQPYLDAIGYLEGTDEAGVKGEIHDGLATLEYKIGNYEEATRHYLIARQYFLQLKWYKKIASNHLVIGRSFLNMGRWAAAEKYYKEGLHIADSLEHTGLVAGALEGLGNLDLAQGQPALAVNNFRKALHRLGDADEEGIRHRLLMGLTKGFREIGKQDSARKYLDQAFVEARKNAEAKALGECFHYKGQSAVDARNYAMALIDLDSAGNWFKKDRNAAGLENVYRLRSQCFEAMGDFPSALSNERLANQWQDSVKTFGASTQLVVLEAKFWSERKEHALELAKKNEALAAAEADRAQDASDRYAAQRNYLISLLVLTVLFAVGLYWINLRRRRTVLERKLAEMRMTALRAQMNPHFIFNALGSVQMLINTSAIREANLYLSKFAQLLRITLERSGQEKCSLEDEIEALRLYIDLEALRFKFKYEIILDEELDAGRIAFPSLLLQPLVENAVKHGLAARQSPGEMRVEFKASGQVLVCTVQDNGVGRAGVKKRNHEDEPSRRSFGVQIVQDRLKLLGPGLSDRFWINDLHDAEGKPNGTLVEVRVPLSYL